ncbi:MAG: hypothetical protein HY317_03870 [Acidobacteria bacterium]|nr:hypothetical protein [Acidobacteriota bacterium]
MALPRCVYCGAGLPRSPGPAAEAPAAPPSDRWLVILDLTSADPEAAARALGLPAFETLQRIRRGGEQLHRVAPRPEAEGEAARLTAAGLRVSTLPEAEAREAARPVTVHGGRLGSDALHVRTSEGEERLEAAEVLLVVRGPVVLERQVDRPKRRTLILQIPRNWDDHVRDVGERIHLHRRSAVRPCEIDPAAFEFGDAPPVGGSLVQIMAWIAALAPAAPADEGFRLLAPVLSPAESATGGVVVATRALSSRRKPPPAGLVLDNLAQFRFYSGWRASLERRRAGTAG